MNRLPSRLGLALFASLAFGGPATAQPTFERPRTYQPNEEELAEIRARTDSLGKAIAELRPSPELNDPRTGEPLADVIVYQKAARWIVEHGEFFGREDVAWTLEALGRGLHRAQELADGKPTWISAKGSLIRGYVSRVDGSVQPYAVVVPDSYDPDRRARLDVVLHGRNDRLNEVRFLHEHYGRPAQADAKGLVLHVFGRTNNAYRWSGEADVFEAIAALKRNYSVDERRIALRGFSMGGAGAWHLGLHHPGLWCSVEAGAGFTDTKGYLKLGELPPYQEKALSIYDAVDYALNAFDVPIAGYGGEDDKQLQASINIKEALERAGVRMARDGLITRGEGLDFLQVIGAKTGHKIDPESAKILAQFRDEHADRGLDPRPKRTRFVTYTLKYNRAHWLTVVRLREHYERAEVEVEIADDTVVVSKADNVLVLAVDRDAGETIRLGEQSFPLRPAVKGLLPQVYFHRVEDRWEPLDYEQSRALEENARREKRHDLQGPIDDAFTGPFLCVRGTGTPWSPAVQRWADARLKRFGEVWSKSLRGDLPVKNDADVSDEDIASRHLILFGDPGSNRLIARVLAELPLKWTRDAIELAGRHPSADHAPALIAPNPLNPYRYVVLNSGHTFGADAFAGSNALLYPRLGDHAVFRIDGEAGEVKLSGYFDEAWKPK